MRAAVTTARKKTARPAVTKYSFRAHRPRLHESAAMATGLEAALALAPREAALLGVNQGAKISVAQRQAAGL